MRLYVSILCLLVALSGCLFDDGGDANADGLPKAPGESEAVPLDAAKGQWTWIDIPGSVCDDGSPTGIAVNPGRSGNLVLFLQGGGGCCDYLSCHVLGTSTHGPYGARQFAGERFAGSVLDRDQADNPLRDDSFVFVPYCTSDLHAGNRVATYSFGGDNPQYHHRGRANLARMLPRVVATFPRPGRLVVSGSSAGGFGSALNYAYLRGAFPGARAYLVDDSGPPLVSEGGVAYCRHEWNAEQALDTFCPGCIDEPARLVRTLSRQFPRDRLALLSMDQDLVISAFLGVSADEFRKQLNILAVTTLGPLPNFRYFFVSGLSHTMLGQPAGYRQGEAALPAWLQQMVSDDPQWRSQRP